MERQARCDIFNKLNLRYDSDITRVSAAYNAGEFVVDAWNKSRSFQDVRLWIESVPFKETRGYVKNSWRNFLVYNYLQKSENLTKVGLSPTLMLKVVDNLTLKIVSSLLKVKT